MPYIVTTRRSGCGWGENCPTAHPDASSRAVATLEEAHETAREACLYAPGSVDAIAQAVRDVFALPESGGMVGPLPDGTVIEVEQRQWYQLAETVGWHPDRDEHRGEDELIAAYNAKHAEPV